MLLEKLNISSETTTVILSVAIMLFMGFLGTRVTKKLRLPDVTAYILVGILLVPLWSVLPVPFEGIIPKWVVNGMDFLTDIALAFIAFSAGEFFRLPNLKKSGVSVIVITLMEAVLASTLVFCVCFFVLGIKVSFSLVLAALASATAPASTLMTIRQTKAKGKFVNTLLEVVVLDDVVSLVLYTIAISVCLAIESGGAGLNSGTIILPVVKNLICIILGFGFGFLLKMMISAKRTTDNRLIILIALIFLFCGICLFLDQSPLLGCMAMGMVYINLTDDDNLFKQLAYFSPPIMLCFFVRSGMNFNLRAFTDFSLIGHVPLFLVAIIYFVVRIGGKYGGAYLGGLVTRQDKPIRKYLGLGLVPQAGVAIGLASMGARILGGVDGDNLQTIILASSVLYELVGPGLAKLSLYLSKSYSNEIDDIVPVETLTDNPEKLTAVDALIMQISTIREEYQKNHKTTSPEEDAFNEAIQDYYENMASGHRRNRFVNRRGK
ncbi:MAG: cation:proton antiporter [Clostridia bacterium]|nr:cation:proton antiporter [Clostridia bacterium]